MLNRYIGKEIGETMAVSPIFF